MRRDGGIFNAGQRSRPESSRGAEILVVAELGAESWNTEPRTRELICILLCCQCSTDLFKRSYGCGIYCNSGETSPEEQEELCQINIPQHSPNVE